MVDAVGHDDGNASLVCTSGAYTYYNFVWFSSEEATLLATIGAGVVVLLISLLAYAALWQASPVLRHKAFGAAVLPESDPVPIWHTWRNLARVGFKCAIADVRHLEDQLFFSFLRMHLNVFLCFALVALPVLIPINATRPSDVESSPPPPPPSSPPAPPPSAPVAPPAPDAPDVTYGLLQLCSLTHLPQGSLAFTASAVFMYVFTWIYLFFLRREWVAFVWRRHNWQLRRRHSVDDFTALFHVGRSGISAGELEERLRRVLPGEIYAVVPIAKRRLCGGRVASRKPELVVQANASDPCELRVVTVVPISRPNYAFTHRSFRGVVSKGSAPRSYDLLTPYPLSFGPQELKEVRPEVVGEAGASKANRKSSSSESGATVQRLWPGRRMAHSLGHRWKVQQEQFLQPFDRLQLLSELSAPPSAASGANKPRESHSADPVLQRARSFDPDELTSSPLVEHSTECLAALLTRANSAFEQRQQSVAAGTIQRRFARKKFRALLRAQNADGARTFAAKSFSDEAVALLPWLWPKHAPPAQETHARKSSETTHRHKAAQKQARARLLKKKESIAEVDVVRDGDDSAYDRVGDGTRNRRRQLLGRTEAGACLERLASSCLDLAFEFILDVCRSQPLTPFAPAIDDGSAACGR